jgi:hypothetical protein
MALLGLEGALKHYYYYYYVQCLGLKYVCGPWFDVAVQCGYGAGCKFTIAVRATWLSACAASFAN